MNRVGKHLFELLVMKLSWGPWNLWVGIVWTIVGDVAADVTFARVLFGFIGTVWLVGVAGFSYISHIEVVGATVTLGLQAACLVIYGLHALFLRGVLHGRDEHLFSLP